MRFFIFLYLVVTFMDFGENFFFFPEKKSLYFCLKVCPLYCWKRHKRSPGHIYWSDESYDWPSHHDHYHRHPVGWWVYCKATTPAPTTTMATTTEEPTFICEVCEKKCKDWKP